MLSGYLSIACLTTKIKVSLLWVVPVITSPTQFGKNLICYDVVFQMLVLGTHTHKATVNVALIGFIRK